MIDFLYTNIGRGHPHYLDGIIECLPQGTVGRVADVFSVSAGASRVAWSVVRGLYRAGGRGGLVSACYGRMRAGNDYNRRSMSLDVLGRGLRQSFTAADNRLLVAHPLLAALLKGRDRLIYQHGEVVAPKESMVEGGHRIFVPLSQTADAFVQSGFFRDQVFVSGLCIEPSLAALAEHAMNSRSQRLSGSGPLCGAFFSSGAEPRAHLETITAAALSVHRGGGRSIVFAQRAGRLERRLMTAYRAAGCGLTITARDRDAAESPSQTRLCLYSKRSELNQLTARFFAEFDYFVAPAHERTNWALGIGLPMYVVDPTHGSFAPLNRGFLLNAGVAVPLRNVTEAALLAETIEVQRRSGRLQEMADAGWRRYDIVGFQNIAEMLEFER